MNVDRQEDPILLSIIVPVAGMAGKLDHLRSWLHEICDLPLEVVIVHDVKDKETSLELKDIIAHLDSHRILFTEGSYGSPGLARNAGMELRRGEWVIFWDSDDQPNVKLTYDSIICAPTETEIIIGNFQKSKRGVTQEIFHKGQLSRVSVDPGIWRMIFRTKLLKDIQFKEYLMGEDQLFLAKMGLATKKIYFTNKLLYTYYQGNSHQLTTNHSNLVDLVRTSEDLSIHLKNSVKPHDNFALQIQSKIALTLWRSGLITFRRLLSYKPTIMAKLLAVMLTIRLEKIVEVIQECRDDS